MSDEFDRVKLGLDQANEEIQELEHAKVKYKDEYIPRVWQDRETGEIVRVTNYQYVVGEGARRVIYTSVGMGHETAMLRQEFEKRYKVYENQHTTRI